MTYSQLELYNDALTIVEERELASLIEDRKPRRLLDGVWTRGGVLACLEEGLWTFAARTTQINANPNIQPAFGYLYAFQKPTDYVRTISLSCDPYFQASFTQYADENNYWWADINVLFVKYVSNDVNYGQNLGLWPESFKRYTAAYFASKIIGSLSHSADKKAVVIKEMVSALEGARGKDAMNEPPRFFPRGSWTRARHGQSSGRINRTGSSWC